MSMVSFSFLANSAKTLKSVELLKEVNVCEDNDPSQNLCL